MARLIPVVKNYDPAPYGFTPHLPEVFDASMLMDYIDCPSYFYLRHVLGLAPKRDGGNPALRWGSKWHEVMYSFHRERSIPEALRTLHSVWPDVLNELDAKSRTEPRMERLLLEYAQKYDHIDRSEWHTILREQYFDVECKEEDNCLFGGCGLRWSGRMDRVTEREPSGRVYVWDYKTTSYMRGSFLDELKHGFQIPGYVWAACHLTTEDVVGAMIDQLYATKTKESMNRYELRLTDQHIVEWRDNVKGIISEIRQRYSASSHSPEEWPKNWNQCYRYSTCMFTPIHTTPAFEDVRMRIMEQDFVEDRWDPSQFDG